MLKASEVLTSGEMVELKGLIDLFDWQWAKITDKNGKVYVIERGLNG